MIQPNADGLHLIASDANTLEQKGEDDHRFDTTISVLQVFRLSVPPWA